jgi:N-succinyldiaminopimelate aminotransferase
MNPDLNRLHPYPFERLRALFAGQDPSPEYRFISLSIGEPKHAAPSIVIEALANANHGLGNYPTARGIVRLREAINRWLVRRYGVPGLDVDRQILPVAGTREALFAICQALVDRTRPDALVVCPNPFYQIYEGAALMAGATPIYANIEGERGAVHYRDISHEQWQRVQIAYVCSPGNPTGAVMDLGNWRELFELSDRYGFTIISDECYSEIYFGEHPPLGSLEAAFTLGRKEYPRLIAFTSLSKRSNVPGMRSGFVAGDAKLLDIFTLYRTYHGAALSPVFQEASIAAWDDEAHVIENRALYRAKFDAVTPRIRAPLATRLPDAAFYLWVKTPIDDEEFARRLFAAYNVAVLPGSYLGRAVHGVNPGQNHIRIALVADFAECEEAVTRISEYATSL